MRAESQGLRDLGVGSGVWVVVMVGARRDGDPKDIL